MPVGKSKGARKAAATTKKKRGSKSSESDDQPKRKRKRSKPPNHRKNIKKIIDTNEMNEQAQVGHRTRISLSAARACGLRFGILGEGGTSNNSSGPAQNPTGHAYRLCLHLI